MNVMATTLTDRLRVAALSRADDGGRVVGTRVIDDTSIVDLRSFEDRGPVSRASAPAPLNELAGRFDDVGDVGDLYDETPKRRWFERRNTPATARAPMAQRPLDLESVAPETDEINETEDDEIDLTEAADPGVHAEQRSLFDV